MENGELKMENEMNKLTLETTITASRLRAELNNLENELLELDLMGSNNYRYRKHLWDAINNICVQLREAEAS